MNPQWVNVLILVVLAAITAIYAYHTRRIAKTSADAAEAAIEQAKELKQQRISASQPVLWPMILGWEYNKIEVIFENIGNGRIAI